MGRGEERCRWEDEVGRGEERCGWEDEVGRGEERCEWEDGEGGEGVGGRMNWERGEERCGWEDEVGREGRCGWEDVRASTGGRVWVRGCGWELQHTPAYVHSDKHSKHFT